MTIFGIITGIAFWALTKPWQKGRILRDCLRADEVIVVFGLSESAEHFRLSNQSQKEFCQLLRRSLIADFRVNWQGKSLVHERIAICTVRRGNLTTQFIVRLRNGTSSMLRTSQFFNKLWPGARTFQARDPDEVVLMDRIALDISRFGSSSEIADEE